MEKKKIHDMYKNKRRKVLLVIAVGFRVCFTLASVRLIFRMITATGCTCALQ